MFNFRTTYVNAKGEVVYNYRCIALNYLTGKAYVGTESYPHSWPLRSSYTENYVEKMCGEEKIFCTGPTTAANSEQNPLVLALQAQRTNQERTPFICTL